MNFKKKVSGSWVDVPHYVSGTGTETITTLPATIYPLAQTATFGLKGNTVQNGTPTPDNPIMPQGAGERTGNLFDDVTESGFYNDDGVLVPDTTVSHSTTYMPVDGTTYTISGLWTGTTGATNFAVYEWDNNKNWLRRSNRQVPASSTLSFTVGSDAAFITLQIKTKHNNIMLNTGSTPLLYEPYGYKIPISSANTTTSVYLGEVESTRRIKKLVLTGEETIGKYVTSDTDYCYYVATNPGNNTCLCTHVPYTASVPTGNTIGISARTNTRVCYINLGADVMQAQPSGNTVAGFKEYLAAQIAAGTPVAVLYVLASPITGIVNEPLRKIGDYADTLSNISVPVTAGGDTLSVDTTLQPSEVTVNYKGWHPVADVHKRDNGQWD